jgi:putative phosphoribosyl transferase
MAADDARPASGVAAAMSAVGGGSDGPGAAAGSSPADHPFPDRRAAGVELAARLERLRREAPVILALEPGGVPVGAVVAEELAAPFGVIAVARIGEPGRRVGAVAEDGPPLVDHDLARAFGIGPAALALARGRAEAAVARRLASRATPLPELTGRTVVLVGDGLATGRAAAAAGRAVRRRGAARIVAAAPVASAQAIARLGEEVDEVVCVRCAALPGSMHDWYDQPLPAEESQVAVRQPGGAVIRDEDGVLTVPEAARGLIVLAPPAHTAIADVLAGAGFATLRLSGTETSPDALSATIEPARARPQARLLATGYFGAGPGAAAVLGGGADVGAVVAALGHAEPAEERLTDVTAPTLLIAAGEDPAGLRRAHAAHAALRHCDARLVVVAGATSGFSEPGALDQVAHLAVGWFGDHLAWRSIPERTPHLSG